MRVTTYLRLLLIASLLFLSFGCSNVKSPSPSQASSIFEQSRPIATAKKVPVAISDDREEKTASAPVLKTRLKPVQKAVPDAVQPAPEPPESPESAVRQPNFYQIGKASFYADKFQSRKTASGERFDQKAKTAAHKKLPFGTKVKVINKRNKKSVIVTINDRGPFVGGRIIDLSRFAFSRIGSTKDGVLDVRIQIIDQPDES